MIKYFLAAILLITSVSLSATTNEEHKKIPDVVPKDQLPNFEEQPMPAEESTDKSTLDVEVVNYPVPNNDEVSFPVNVRKNSLEKEVD
jgi:hypothetical protein